MADIPEFEFDRAGFPMIYVKPLDAYIHWMPVTKVQFETFMCAAPDSRFDERWYTTMLSLNERVAPSAVNDTNYYRAFITGILPQEIQTYAEWCGEEYFVPNVSEWMEAYKYFKTRDPITLELEKMNKLSERSRTLLKRLETAPQRILRNNGTTRKMHHQMLFRKGVMEWVQNPGRVPWGGLGETNSDFYGDLFTPEEGRPKTPNNPETERLYYYGFRLLRRRE